VTTNDARYSPEIKSRISMDKEHSNRRLSSTSELNLRVKLVNCYICNSLCGAENFTLPEEGQKYLKIFEM
jgi:hypothetical protein